ncbi:ABC transporter permease [Thermoflexus sp.]|uniref:ABC transporter permease n=1 Tax=Thermoflexus sp. TaxID=1969742 RepID=UPI0025DEBB05|nr:ABC transporter permease [Thermoflexus sp.]MDW8064463.1 ABC transporter permease [Anaerolineae bacterium]MCS6964539.1 ABC transporter permease [Thermoflexus sp.]MCS7351280.1 ABC transporter permease [Thermoflexus sp.]MCX7690925.1 ABC transporter permease [Thermoflexus sp.]MDW8180734.1 ABC transporter permease [Anaerolineae bacterium]
MAFLKTVYTIWYRDLLRFLRDRTRIVSSLGQPLLFLLVFGNGLAPAVAAGMAGVDFRTFLFPGILSMAVLFTAVFSAVSIVWDREFGFLKEVLVAPVSRAAVALGKVAGGSTTALLQGLLIMLLAPLVGVRFTLPQILTLIAMMILVAATMTSFGILIAARMRSMEGFHMMMNFLLMPMFFMSGAFFPLREVPLWMEWLARVDPVTYGVDAIRQTTLQGLIPEPLLKTLILHPLEVNLIALIAFWMLFLIPAVWLFSRTE